MKKQKKLWYENKIMVGGNKRYAEAYDIAFGKKEVLNIMSNEEREAIEKEKSEHEVEGRKGYSQFNGMDKFLQIKV